MDNIGVKIKRYRQLNDLNLQQLAGLVGISHSYLSLIESGKKIPSDKILKKLKEIIEGNNLQSEEGSPNSDEIVNKKNVLTGFGLKIMIGVLETTIEVTTKINEEHIDKPESKDKYNFESPIVVNAIREFIKENEDKLEAKILNSLRKEVKKLASDYGVDQEDE